METASSLYTPEARQTREGLAICLSGGGFRAALFHAGTLRRLNELGILSKARTISSVSGGSITNGFLADAWPSLTPDAGGVFTNWAQQFEKPLLAICSQDIRTGPLLWMRLNPLNWRRLASATYSAADLLAEQYDAHLNGRRLVDLPEAPNFIFCAANLGTGVNFEFSRSRMGDYVLGYAPPGETLLAEAVAASSAFPIAFPPLVRDYDAGAFHKGDANAVPTDWSWNGRVTLGDGGVYDNMALEPAWKTHADVLVSDGGTPFQPKPSVGRWMVPRLWRSYGIIANQAEALRKRWLVASFLKGVYGGAYWGLGTDISEYASSEAGTNALPGYSGKVLDRLRVMRTDLDAFSPDEQGVLLNHGWALANGAIRRWAMGLARNTGPDQVPDAALLDENKALMALAESDETWVFGRG
jgi:NTE family protein